MRVAGRCVCSRPWTVPLTHALPCCLADNDTWKRDTFTLMSQRARMQQLVVACLSLPAQELPLQTSTGGALLPTGLYPFADKVCFVPVYM